MSRPVPSRLVVLGHPGHRRVTLFQDALARLGAPPARVVAWRDVLTDPRALTDVLDASTWLRIDSPGEDLDVFRRILARGADMMTGESGECIDAAAAMAWQPDGSGLRYARQRHLGFAAVLADVQRVVEASGARCSPWPDDIVEMSDKTACHARLVAAGVPVAPRIAVDSLAALRHTLLSSHGPDAVFVKQRHGSSAAGVAAVRRELDATWTMITSMGFDGDVPYASLKLRETSDLDTIERVLAWISAEGAHVERWCPKLTVAGRELDVRVVVVEGSPRQTVVRMARPGSPVTNLHLGNDRGDVETVREALGARAWLAGLEAAEAAAACYPRTHTTGVDVMWTPDGEPLVLEVNAFGDLLPGVLWHDQDVWETQARSILGLD